MQLYQTNEIFCAGEDGFLSIWDIEKLEYEYEKLMKRNSVNSKAVFRNYTRFVLSTLRWLDYAHPERRKDIYGNKSVNVYVQTELAKQKVKDLEGSIDIRFQDLERFSDEENAAFALYILFHHLKQINYDVSDPETKEIIDKVSKIGQSIIEQFGINDKSKVLYFPYQETPLHILQLASNYYTDV